MPVSRLSAVDGLKHSVWTETVQRTSVQDGQSAFFLPWGRWVEASQENASVKLDGVPLEYGTSWVFLGRQSSTYGWPQPSTATCSAGIWIIGGVLNGQVVEITWRSGLVKLPAPSPIAVRLEGGALPTPLNRTGWRYSPTRGPGKLLTNGVLFANSPGFQVEIWRKIPKNRGGSYRSGGALLDFLAYRGQQRYMPWFRFPASSDAEVLCAYENLCLGLSESPRSFAFKACWFHESGARSDLSAETIRTWRGTPDRMGQGGTALITHEVQTLYISRG